MPGVPSGRGCDACRKQKKKCDVAVPSCSRCARLGIPCVGNGQKRYKFVGQHQISTCAEGSETKGGGRGPVPSRALGSELTTLANGFRSALAVTDISYDLSIYGDFINDIPHRLGRNEALDASVRAMTRAFSSVRTRQQSSGVFKSYVEALRCLQNTLRDPVKAVSPDTLCAVYLVMICQGWIGRRGDVYPKHGEAIAHMLNNAVEQNWLGAFESNMITTLCTVAIIESIFNPKIRLDPRLWAFSEIFGPLTTVEAMSNIESLKVRNLARITDLLKDSNSDPAAIRFAYKVVQSDCEKIATLLSAVPTIMLTHGGSTSQHLPVSVRRLHVRQQTSYGILLSLAITLNSTLLLHADTSVSSRDILRLEAASYVDEVIKLATEAAQYRPLGSSATPLCLLAAWGRNNDAAKQQRLEALIVEYQSDFELTNWLEVALRIRPRIGTKVS